MSSHCSTILNAGGPTDWFERTRSALLEIFGAPFRLWTHDPDWRPLADATADPFRLTGDEAHDQPGEWVPPNSLLTALIPEGDAPRTVVDFVTYSVWLAIPLRPPVDGERLAEFATHIPSEFRHPEGPPWSPVGKAVVAIGKIPGVNARIVENCATMFLRDVERQAASNALAEENRTLLRQITNDFEELAFLRRTAALLDVSDRTFDVRGMAEAVLPSLRPLCEAQSMVLLAADRDDPSNSPQPIVWAGPRRVDDVTCIRLVQSYRDACRTRPVVKNDFHETTQADQFPGVEGFVLVSIARSHTIVGWLLALNRENEQAAAGDDGWSLSFLEFGTHEASLMASAATILATHFRNMDLFREREELVVSVVRALVTAIEAKDEYTRGHSERVALYAKRLAEEMGFDTEYCERLYLTGLLHDVGKIGVSDSILQKPGALTAAEIDEVKQHPDKGWAILADVEALTYVLPGLLHHHEQFDGGGYPDALSGTDIHIDGRILAVADAYDAMTSDRPYRQGMPDSKAEQILRAGSGRQWDAEIIDLFFRVMPDIERIKQNYEPRIPTTRKPTIVTTSGEPGVASAPAFDFD